MLLQTLLYVSHYGHTLIAVHPASSWSRSAETSTQSPTYTHTSNKHTHIPVTNTQVVTFSCYLLCPLAQPSNKRSSPSFLGILLSSLYTHTHTHYQHTKMCIFLAFSVLVALDTCMKLTFLQIWLNLGIKFLTFYCFNCNLSSVQFWYIHLQFSINSYYRIKKFP